MKQLAWLVISAAFALSGTSALGFALDGPAGIADDAYQVPSIGYALPGDASAAEKQAGEEYRRNTPVMYYAADSKFLGYFGARGLTELDKAFAVFNNLTNVSLYTTNLVEFPTDTELVNERAQSLSLLDLKSMVMHIMTEQLGLFQPVRSIWALRRRITSNVPCPFGNSYAVIPRNLDITSSALGHFQYTSYVNDTLYSYFIYEDCGNPAPPPDADAVEYPVDPLAHIYTAVADGLSLWYVGLEPGDYYTGLTRDDVAGIRYLISTNNFYLEDSGADTVQFTTNAQPTTITNFDLNVFASQAATNGPAALNTLYPDLQITSSSNYFALGVTTNITETLVNSPYDPVGLPPSHALFFTNYTTNVLSLFSYTFGNLITNAFSSRGLVGTVTLSLSNSPYASAGSLPTVVTNVKFSFQSGVFGSFFLLPTNLCSYQLITNLFTQVIATTNFPSGTNLPSGTNVLSGTGTNTAVTFVSGTISFFTNLNPVILPVTCPSDTEATRRGVEKITFLRRDYDSLINQAWDPVTNDYTLYALTNGTFVPQHFRRVVTIPDFLFSASDQADTNLYFRTVAFTQATNVNQPGTFATAGPGIIPPPSVIILNDDGPVFLNSFAQASFLGEPQPLENAQTPEIIWGSFDGTTNDPVVYLNGQSIVDLENELYGPYILQTALPNGEINKTYSAQLTGNGGQGPYTISLVPGSGLPDGLTLTSDGQISGTPTGPAATYDFTIRVTDANGLYKDIAYTLTVDP